MFRLLGAKTFLFTIGVLGMLGTASAQYSSGTMSGSTGSTVILQHNYHIGFERPESWGLKYFGSASLLSGMPAPAPPEGYRFGTITVGLETDWLPQLDEGQRRI